MAAWKCYQWEWETWPEFKTVRVGPDEQRRIIKRLSRHFKIGAPDVRNKRGTWGYARIQFGGQILLPHECGLGLVVHEFAHILAWRRWNYRGGHGKPFKRELKRAYTWAKRWLPKPEERPVNETVGVAQPTA